MNQKEIDSNLKLYEYEVPNEPIKKIMFYFAVLNDVIDYPFPKNFINFEHPYFTSYEQMEEFLALSHSLNPEFLYYNNAIIYYNDKNYYKYYQINDDKDGTPYEFKIVEIEESTNPIFNDNYKNIFNISNIDKNQTKFDIAVQNKVKSIHSKESIEENIEENYLNNDDDSDKYFDAYNNNYDDSINEISDNEISEKNNFVNYKVIKNFCKTNDKIYNSKLRTKNNRYKNQMKSEDELDCGETVLGDFHIERVKINHKLIVTNDWIDFIYNEPQKELLSNMKKAIKKDDIRTKSISLPRNVFFYLEIIVLILFTCSSWLLFSWSTSLKSDDRFKMYKGRKNNIDIQNKTKQKFNESPNLFSSSIDYKNDTVIIPETKKYNKIYKGCQLGQTSSIFATFFLIFLIYMCIRVSREKKEKYKNYSKRKKVGLNICHIFVFILFTLLAFVLTLVAEIYIIISLTQKTYNFIHEMVRNQLIGNSMLFVWYVLIIVFYCKI